MPRPAAGPRYHTTQRLPGYVRTGRRSSGDFEAPGSPEATLYETLHLCVRKMKSHFIPKMQLPDCRLLGGFSLAALPLRRNCVVQSYCHRPRPGACHCNYSCSLGTFPLFQGRRASGNLHPRVISARHVASESQSTACCSAVRSSDQALLIDSLGQKMTSLRSP